MTMIPPSNSTLSLPLPLVRGHQNSAISSELEIEIVSLFDELRNPLLRYVISFGLSGADGEEVVQEAFLSLFHHLRKGRPRQNLRGWLFRVAHNLALKRLSGNERRREMADLGVIHAEICLDSVPNPEEQTAFSQRKARLLAVLRALPDQDQNCLRLRAEGLKYREIAGILGMSLGSISASLARSLARLARMDGR